MVGTRIVVFSHAQAHIEVVVNDKAERRELQFSLSAMPKVT